MIEKPILLTVHRPWSNNDRLREDRFNRLFAPCFRPVERRRRVDIGVEVGDMYKTRHSILSADSSNPLRAGDMYVVELEISRRMVNLGTSRVAVKEQSLCLKVFSDEIIDNVRVPYTFRDLFLVADVEFERNNLSEVSARPEVPYRNLIPIREDYLRSDLGYSGNSARERLRRVACVPTFATR